MVRTESGWSGLKRLGLILAAGLMLSVAVACPQRPMHGLAETERPVWPPYPDSPRIRYEQSFRVPRDLGIRRNWLARAASWVVRGSELRGMARPYAVAVADDGRVIVADPDGRSVHVYDVTRSRYHRIMEADGELLVSPIAVATDPEGRIYVSDSGRKAVFRFGRDAEWIDQLGEASELRRPTGLTFDRARGRLYVVDTLGHCIVGFDREGREVIRFGRRGAGDAEFNYPVAIATDPAGRLYVVDSMNFRIQVLDADGLFVRKFGRPGQAAGSFDKAKGIAVDRDGQIYVVEGLHDVVQVFDSQGALLTVIGGNGAGPGEFWLPAGIHIANDNRIFIADSANRRVQVLRYLVAQPPGDST